MELFGFSNLTDEEEKQIDGLLQTLSIISLDSRLPESSVFCAENIKLKFLTALLRRQQFLPAPLFLRVIFATFKKFTTSLCVKFNEKIGNFAEGDLPQNKSHSGV